MADVEHQQPQRPSRMNWTNFPGIMKYSFIGTYDRYKKAPIFVKALVWLFICINIAVLTILFVWGPGYVAQTLYNWSQVLKNMPFGWLLLASIIAVTSLPPLVGWSTSISVCGFAYGLSGWFVAAGGAMSGAMLSFILLRYLLAARIKFWSQKNQKWTALENVIRARGLPLIILIRLSPFPPWVYANLMFASIETVSFFQFMLATVFYTPKLMIAVWIGSRVAMLSDGTQRDKMDTKAKIVNSVSIVAGIALSVWVGWLVWRLTEKEIRKSQGVSEEEGHLSTEALESAAEDFEAPLIRSLSLERYRDEPLESAGHARSLQQNARHSPTR